MEEFRVIKSEMPIIEANFDEVKANLQQMLEDYKGLVVTEDTLFACKDAQKEFELGDIDKGVLDDFMAQLDQETEWENLKYDM